MRASTKDRLRKLSVLYKVTVPFVAGYRRANMLLGRLLRGGGMRVVFSSFSGRSYSDNPRYISEKLHEMCPEAQITWLFRDPAAAETPGYIEKLDMTSRHAFRRLGCARVWVDNYVKRPYIYPRKGRQFYIQTWHGDRAFKKVGFDRPPVPKRLAEECADLCVAGSDYGERQFRSALHYYGPVLKEGYPRNDILVRSDPAQIREVRRRLGVADDAKLVLYAPTFRDSIGWRRQEVPLDLARVLDRLERKTGEKWLCLMRAHYLSGGLAARDLGRRGLDVSGYGEMAELLLVADLLITDYSSCAGDFALTGRPILLYQNDIEQYSRNDREMYFAMEDSPYLAAHNPDEMEALIDRLSPEAARENDRAILEFYGTHETGRASERVCEYIIDKLRRR